MKYVPQQIVCPNGDHGNIITEDIPRKDLTLQPNQDGGIDIHAQIKCPICQAQFQVLFVHRRQVGNESLFECEIEPNRGLQMWRLIIDGEPKPPVYQPIEGNRSPYEQTIDSWCKTIADLIYLWNNQPQLGQDLVNILGEVVDYTKMDSWKTFKKRHYMVNVCGREGSSFYAGFSGKFDVVKKKNQQLSNAFVKKLGSDAEKKSNQFCNNLIGHCAEMHAANLCLNQDSLASLPNLRFSIAYTCRFGSSRPHSYCLNCITLFDLKNE